MTAGPIATACVRAPHSTCQPNPGLLGESQSDLVLHSCHTQRASACADFRAAQAAPLAPSRAARAPACDLAPCSSPAPMRPRDPARRTARKCRGPRPPQLAELDQLMSLVSSTYIPTGKVCRVESKAARPYVGGNQTVLVRVRAQISTCLRARCALWTRGRGRRRAPPAPPPPPPTAAQVSQSREFDRGAFGKIYTAKYDGGARRGDPSGAQQSWAELGRASRGQ